MNPERTKQHASCPGFTLIELMMVVAIIAVLASLTIGGLRYYDEKTKYSRTEVLIKSIESALEEYKRDNGAYPTGADTTVVFTALYGAGTNVYLSTLNPDFTGTKGNVSATTPRKIIDAWGNEMGYTFPGAMNPVSDFDLWSNGSDGTNNTADDIKNW
ncbi:MAG: type II secretion system protein [Akkermansiaceae bacterium]